MGSYNTSEDFYFGSSMPYCRAGNVSGYIYNITSPYTDDTNKSSIIGTSVAMFTLTVLFFNLTMFRHIGAGVRVARSAALSLFLPVMSYLFSDAKNAGGATVSTDVVTELIHPELPMRARLILTWMLLVELLRKRTEAVSWAPAAAGYTGNAEQAARIAWLGSLVFSTIQSPGRRAVFGVLWVVAAAKMVQRFVIRQVIRCSFATGRNPEIIGAYTVHALERRSASAAENTDLQGELTSCELAVMGEEKVKMKTGPHGYVAYPSRQDIDGVVTVGKIWRDGGDLPVEAKKFCLSFALYKLLRRRLEDARARASGDDLETRALRDLIVGEGRRDAEELLRVVADEASFLRQYYQSADPVVLASPFFLLANYALFPAALACVCLMTVVACGSGDVPGTARSVRADNYVMSLGLARTVVCLMRKVLASPAALLSAIDLGITFFLAVACVYEELSELGALLLSDWFLVSLTCSYARHGRRLTRRAIASSSIRCILRVGRVFAERERVLKLKQLELASTAFRAPMVLPRSPLPATAKAAVVKHLTNCIRIGGGAIALGNCAAWQHAMHQLSSSAYDEDDSTSIAQVILTWHVATTLLEAWHPQRNNNRGAAGDGGDDRSTATTLSRYCAYLVAFRPELLPNDCNDTQHVYGTMVCDLKKRLGCWGYYFCRKRDWLQEIAKSVNSGDAAGKKKEVIGVVQKGIVLGEALRSSGRSSEQLWNMLAELWVELVVYVAPACEGANLQGHYAALVEGDEFITLVWALATHGNLTRQPLASTTRVGAVGSDLRP